VRSSWDYSILSIAAINEQSLQKFPVSFFIKSKRQLRSAKHHRPANEIRFLGHQLDGFGARRRMLFHSARAIKFISRVQKIFVITLAYQFFELGFAQSLFIQIARFQLRAQFQQETSCFAARRSRRLLQKSDFHLWQSSLLPFLFPGLCSGIRRGGLRHYKYEPINIAEFSDRSPPTSVRSRPPRILAERPTSRRELPRKPGVNT